ncbi:glutamine-hydrolyzing GMP synthase [Puniceicoccales bacterium CK1056]|uniref:GMP synthase [glutamine-hydrolyzing] n=1 Tax=Oceanipulchritudo coccoides TaxID=2706888 RepID=A0A6B2M390_9BACT|nr:glutamine-hydrolyzing GMP synthase [Oceanipulchritudo coccoides]NDV62669.1 glutamine-hydrolyzing GMP synthase [Oceanipulchritudo coccoides]
MPETIAVLDFGSQYTQVIARRLREFHVYSKVYRFDTPASELKADGVNGIILSGGPSSVFSESAPMPDPDLFSLEVPVLGICYGLQLLGRILGGKVEKSTEREYGRGTLNILNKSALFKDLPDEIQVWNSHGDRLIELPAGFMTIGKTENSDFAAIENRDRRIFGLQFHPEVFHTERGTDIIRNFLIDICQCKGDWTMAGYIEMSVEKIRKTVGDRHVILGLSGGVDSSVAAALIHRAIGEQLTCVFVDNGLLRKDEVQAVEKLFGDNFHMNLVVSRTADLFLDKLVGVTDPERKRKIIGNTFVEVFEQEVEKIGEVDFLAQGTIYPDVIESVPIGGNPAALIKSHHNVGGLPERMKLKILEPLNQLFKDEVRRLGEELGLPKSVVWRQPFPGPGLAVRIIGDITPERLRIVREADAILMEEMKAEDYYYKVWQSFAVFLPVQSVGVMGDERTYDFVIALRIVESIDAMTADWARLPHEFLQKVSNRIINEVQGVNRVVLDISSKPPSTIEWE